jgi:hypothetical protein
MLVAAGIIVLGVIIITMRRTPTVGRGSEVLQGALGATRPTNVAQR